MSPSSTKELQQGALGYWHKLIAVFAIIVCPLYNVLRKGKSWVWDKQHEDALELLNELSFFYFYTEVLFLFIYWGSSLLFTEFFFLLFSTARSLTPNQTYPRRMWFSEHGSYWDLWQKGREEPERLPESGSHSFNYTETRYSDPENESLPLVWVVKQAK